MRACPRCRMSRSQRASLWWVRNEGAASRAHLADESKKLRGRIAFDVDCNGQNRGEVKDVVTPEVPASGTWVDSNPVAARCHTGLCCADYIGIITPPGVPQGSHLPSGHRRDPP